MRPRKVRDQQICRPLPGGPFVCHRAVVRRRRPRWCARPQRTGARGFCSKGGEHRAALWSRAQQWEFIGW